MTTEQVFLAHCSVSPLHQAALLEAERFLRSHAEKGIGVFREFPDVLGGLRASIARMLQVADADVAVVTNTSVGLSMVANGYTFSPGDEVICYAHEYPANFHPWQSLERLGVKLVLLEDASCGVGSREARPQGWSFEALRRRVTPRTRMLAISHVQYTSGFTSDLELLGAFCREQQIDLVVDAAQSLGVLPLYPARWNVAAVAASGWKWLLGPLGVGILYAAPAFRDKLRPTLYGADMMQQQSDYSDLSWNPYPDARQFQFSTQPYALAAGLQAAVDACFAGESMEAIRDRVLQLQDQLLAELDPGLFTPLRLEPPQRSGILSCTVEGDLQRIATLAAQHGVTVVPRGNYLRLAPHFYQRAEQMLRAAAVLNEAAHRAS
ncbi:MAG: aminotransferase class V-fold PLP-dependent enzyme [Bdellovibrionales bacterium]|nr:aminotransferase class V-fold PLP-dependent enzyme [Bdellovibrionales bacterium]